MTRRALVTGVSRGLGAHLARRLLEDGWSLLGVSRGAPPPSLDGLQHRSLDLGDPDAAEQIAEWCGTCPELVVHNAAMYPALEAASRPSQSAIEGVFRVNAVAPYLITRALLGRLAEAAQSSIVMVNSDAMFHADAASGVYAASKAAHRVLATSLASTCRGTGAAVSTVLFGPLADEGKVRSFQRLSASKGVSEEELVELFLRRSNPDLTITRLIDFESCYRCVRHVAELGSLANGMLLRLDGGSSGSLI
jgi:NAD(P)-dependent dehydrogenase (short-subunit alcohol dehydrogenase family)